IRNSVTAGAVAVSPLQPVGSSGGYVFLRGGTAWLVFTVHFVGACGAVRPDQHDGIQPSAVERDADRRGVDADPGAGDGISAAALFDLADGRSSAPVVCDGGGAARGARGRGHSDQCAAQSGGGDCAVAGGRDAKSFVVWMAADLRGRVENDLRHRLADSVPRRQTLRRTIRLSRGQSLHPGQGGKTRSRPGETRTWFR